MRNLPPSLRKRKRYVAFKLISERDVAKEDFVKALWSLMLSLFGEFDGEVFKLIHFENNIGIVACCHRNLNKLKIALTLIDRVGEIRTLPIILGVSGTLKRCRKKYSEVLKDANSTNGI
uniref:Ribonuclease P protein component 2 n=1 Tax=Geoglobus ahangari TaxID=113653 RepID=A0A7C3UD38_9EURY